MFKRSFSLFAALFFSAPVGAKQSADRPAESLDIDARLARAHAIFDVLERPIDNGGVTRDKEDPNKLSWWNWRNFGNFNNWRNFSNFSNFRNFQNFHNFHNFSNFKNFSNFQNFHNAPAFHNAPTFHNVAAPTFHNAPTFNNAPTFHNVPTVHNAPTFTNAPVHTFNNSAPVVNAPAHTFSNAPTFNVPSHAAPSLPTLGGRVPTIPGPPQGVRSGFPPPSIGTPSHPAPGVPTLNTARPFSPGAQPLHQAPTIPSAAIIPTHRAPGLPLGQPPLTPGATPPTTLTTRQPGPAVPTLSHQPSQAALLAARNRVTGTGNTNTGQIGTHHTGLNPFAPHHGIPRQPHGGSPNSGCSTITGPGMGGGGPANCSTSGASRLPAQNPRVQQAKQLIRARAGATERGDWERRNEIAIALVGVIADLTDEFGPDAADELDADFNDELMQDPPADFDPNALCVNDQSHCHADIPQPSLRDRLRASLARHAPPDADNPPQPNVQDPPPQPPPPPADQPAPPEAAAADQPPRCDTFVAEHYVAKNFEAFESDVGDDQPLPAACIPVVEAMQKKSIGSDWEEIDKIKSYFEKQTLPPGNIGNAEVGQPTTHLEAVPLNSGTPVPDQLAAPGQSKTP